MALGQFCSELKPRWVGLRVLLEQMAVVDDYGVRVVKLVLGWLLSRSAVVLFLVVSELRGSVFLSQVVNYPADVVSKPSGIRRSNCTRCIAGLICTHVRSVADVKFKGR